MASAPATPHGDARPTPSTRSSTQQLARRPLFLPPSNEQDRISDAWLHSTICGGAPLLSPTVDGVPSPLWSPDPGQSSAGAPLPHLINVSGEQGFLHRVLERASCTASWSIDARGLRRRQRPPLKRSPLTWTTTAMAMWCAWRLRWWLAVRSKR
jgi:hypothetical protein